MVKAYLRYELAAYFGGLNTNRCVTHYDEENKQILTGCGEYVQLINITKGEIMKKISIKKNTQITYITKSFQEFPEFIACGCMNGDVVLINLSEEDAEHEVLSEHEVQVSCLDFNKQNNFQVSGSLDNTIIVWDTISYTAVVKFTGHSAPITNVQFVDFMYDKSQNNASYSKKDMMLLSSSKDGCLRIWDVNVQFCVDVIPSSKNEVTYFINQPLIGKDIYLYSTNTEDLVFIELGQFEKKSENSQNSYTVKTSYREVGRFSRDKFSKVNQIVCDEERGQIFLITEKNQIEILKIMNETEVKKKYKRK